MTDPITRAREALAAFRNPDGSLALIALADEMYGALRVLLAIVEAEPSDTEERNSEPTDGQVLAALDVYHGQCMPTVLEDWEKSSMDRMRNTLRAAARAIPDGPGRG